VTAPGSIGFIGIGNQGAPIAHRIHQAGMPLVVWARRREATASFTAAGVPVAASIAELGSQCRHVGICVLTDADVLEVCAELIPAMAPGSLVAVHSTILPATAETVAELCAAAGLRFVDAPVSGGETVARAGALVVMCGADGEAFAAARPVFETFGKTIVLLGPAGSGQRAKLINNALLSANMAAAAAALDVAGALAIDKAALAEVIGHGSGRSLGFELVARSADPALFAHGNALLRKDLDLLMAMLGDNAGAQTLCAAADAYLARGMQAGAASPGPDGNIQHKRAGNAARGA